MPRPERRRRPGGWLLGLALLVLPGACLPYSGPVYLAPPAEGVVLDGRTGEPVAGATVSYLRHAARDTTGPDGGFRLPAVSERRFMMIMAGGAADLVPIEARHPDSGSGMGWARQRLGSTAEPPLSRVLVVLLPQDAEPESWPRDCSLDAQAGYAARVAGEAGDALRLDRLRGPYGADPEPLERWRFGVESHLDRAFRICNLPPDERNGLRAPLREAED